MAKKKQQVGMPVLAHFVYDDRSEGAKNPVWLDAFVLAEDIETLNMLTEQDAYGLRARGYNLSQIFRLQPMGAGAVAASVPTSGMYETGVFIYDPLFATRLPLDSEGEDVVQ